MNSHAGIITYSSCRIVYALRSGVVVIDRFIVEAQLFCYGILICPHVSDGIHA